MAFQRRDLFKILTGAAVFGSLPVEAESPTLRLSAQLLRSNEFLSLKVQLHNPGPSPLDIHLVNSGRYFAQVHLSRNGQALECLTTRRIRYSRRLILPVWEPLAVNQDLDLGEYQFTPLNKDGSGPYDLEVHIPTRNEVLLLKKAALTLSG